MGRPPRIDRRSIVQASMAIANAEGLQGVTMQSVAESLQVTPMALYRHIGTKDDLLKGLVELLVAEIPLPPATMAWRDRLHQWMRSVQGAAHDQPELFLILLDRHRSAPNTAVLHNELRVILHDADLAPAALDHVARVITMVTIGSAAYGNTGWYGLGIDEADPEFAALVQMVDDFVDAQR